MEIIHLLTRRFGLVNEVFPFFLVVNPALFKMFKQHHYILFTIGIIASLINARAMMPFILLILIDMDYSKFDKKAWVITSIFLSLNILYYFANNRWLQ